MRFVWGAAPPTAFDFFNLALAALCIALAFMRPSLFQPAFAAVERRLIALSKLPWFCGLIVFLLPIAGRLLLLPAYGPPAPFIHDEYAYLLQGDTFASGRLANPPLPFANQFETIYVFATPSYSAEYEPGQGLFLALGQKLFGHPWAGVLLSMGLFCAVIYWAFLAWLRPHWAFFGALLVGVEIGVLSYWANSYWGGCVPGAGGALALGALTRLRGRFRPLDAFLLAFGIFILLCTRPVEGALLSVVAGGFLLFWFLTTNVSAKTLLSRVAAPMILLFLPAVVFLAYYNQQVTGKPTEVPYLLYRARYSIPQGFYWQKPPVAKTPMPVDIKAEYLKQEEQRKRPDIIKATFAKVRRFWEFYIGVLLTIFLLAIPFIWREPNMDIVLVSLILVVGLYNLSYFAYFAHYSAAVATAIFLVLLQCIRVVRRWGQAGLFLSRAIPAACVLSLLVAMSGKLAEPFLPASAKRLAEFWDSQYIHWISREKYVPQLEAQPGKQLVLIRYNPPLHENDNAWTFNLANLQDAKIVWARESSDPNENRRMIEYFKGRKVWLAEPDATPQRIIPFPGLSQ
jgi:hypothetical protein